MDEKFKQTKNTNKRFVLVKKCFDNHIQQKIVSSQHYLSYENAKVSTKVAESVLLLFFRFQNKMSMKTFYYWVVEIIVIITTYDRESMSSP